MAYGTFVMLNGDRIEGDWIRAESTAEKGDD